MAKLLHKPELLAPAGDEESLEAAVAAGATIVDSPADIGEVTAQVVGQGAASR